LKRAQLAVIQHFLTSVTRCEEVVYKDSTYEGH